MEAPAFTAVWPGEFGETFTLPVGADCRALAHGAVQAMERYFGRAIPLGTVVVSVVNAEHLAAISSDAGAAVAKTPLPRVGAIPELAFTGGIVVEPRRESLTARRPRDSLVRVAVSSRLAAPGNVPLSPRAARQTQRRLVSAARRARR